MKSTLKLNDYYQTTDLCLCCTLITLGFILDSIDKTNPQKVIFLFKREEGLDETIEDYFKGFIRVEPKLFFANLRFIKSRIREAY